MEDSYVFGLMFLLVALSLYVVFKNDSDAPVSREEVHKMLHEQAGGWIEVVDAEARPLFRGKIMGEIPDEDRLLLIGGLVEYNASEALLSAIGPIATTRLPGGMLLARCITSPNRDVFLGHLQDRAIQESISPHLEKGEEIELCLELNSDEVRFAEDGTNMRTFNASWSKWEKLGIGS